MEIGGFWRNPTGDGWSPFLWDLILSINTISISIQVQVQLLLEFLWCQSYIKEIREYFYKVLPLYRVSGEWTLTYTISATEQENKRTRKSVPTMMQKSQILKYVILENSKISSTKKSDVPSSSTHQPTISDFRPIMLNLPTYLKSDVINGRSLSDET